VNRLSEDEQGHVSSDAILPESCGAPASSAPVPSRPVARPKRRCVMVDPRHSRVMPWWDALTTIALLFIALVTPFEVAFLPAANSPTAPLFLLNRLLDLIFIVDLILNFIIMQPVADVDLGTRWLSTSHEIVRNYLCSWFTLDILSILVSVFDIIPVVVMSMASSSAGATGDESEENLSTLQSLTPLRLLRALRLLRLLRLSKMARILTRWETEMAVNYSTIDLLKCLVLVVLGAHWAACLWGLPVSPLFLEDPTGTWLHRQAYCVDAEMLDEDGYPLPGEWWAGGSQLWRSSTYVSQRGGLACVAPGQVYLYCLYFGFLMVTGGGEPETYMHSNASTEQVVYIIVLILTQCINAFVMATFTTILLTGAPGKIAFQTNMDALNRYMNSQGSRIDGRTRRRLREYFHQSRHLQVAATNTELLTHFSPSLQAELAWRANRRWVQRVPFLVGTELRFMVQLALALRPAVYAPGERPGAGWMYVIHRGIALYGGRMLTSGKVWGDDMLLALPELRAPFICTAMNYLEVFVLGCESLLKIAADFPISQKLIRKKTCRMAFRRMIVYLAKLELGITPSALLCECLEQGSGMLSDLAVSSPAISRQSQPHGPLYAAAPAPQGCTTETTARRPKVTLYAAAPAPQGCTTETTARRPKVTAARGKSEARRCARGAVATSRASAEGAQLGAGEDPQGAPHEPSSAAMQPSVVRGQRMACLPPLKRSDKVSPHAP